MRLQYFTLLMTVFTALLLVDGIVKDIKDPLVVCFLLGYFP